VRERDVEDEQLYMVFSSSPLLTEATKLILESGQGIGLVQIASRLHKKPPTVHRALQKLHSLNLVATSREGRTITYRIFPNRKDVVKNILAKVYHPTESFVIGELINAPLGVTAAKESSIKGFSFNHIIDIVYSKGQDIPTSRVAVEVLTRLDRQTILSTIGKLVDIGAAKIDAFLILVVENGETCLSFTNLERALSAVKPKIDFTVATFLIEKKTPLISIKKAKDWVVSTLKVDKE
jgi:predicted transcriptional regulator